MILASILSAATFVLAFAVHMSLGSSPGTSFASATIEAGLMFALVAVARKARLGLRETPRLWYMMGLFMFITGVAQSIAAFVIDDPSRFAGGADYYLVPSLFAISAFSIWRGFYLRGRRST